MITKDEFCRHAESLEGAMLRHLGQNAYENGYFWEKTPDKLPGKIRGDISDIFPATGTTVITVLWIVR